MKYMLKLMQEEDGENIVEEGNVENERIVAEAVDAEAESINQSITIYLPYNLIIQRNI